MGRPTRILIVVLLALAPLPAWAVTQDYGSPNGKAPMADRDHDRLFDDLEEVISGRDSASQIDVIVVFNSGPSAHAAASARSAIGPFKVRYEYENLPAIAATLTIGQAKALARRSETRHVQLDGRMNAFVDTSRSAFGVDKARLDFSVDGNNSSASCSGADQYCNDDVVVAVIDTGVDRSHVDLDNGKVIAFADCYDATCEDVPAFDDHGHGSHVASIIAGTGQGDPSLMGVAPGAAIVGIKVLNSSGSGSTAGVDAGIDWAIQNRTVYGIRALNLSLGSGGSSDGTDSTSLLVNAAAAAGITPFVAAGNSGPDPYSIGSPAAAADAVTIGAMSDPGDNEGSFPPGFALAYFSSRGPTADDRTKPDLAAAGVDIRAAQAGSGSGYITYSGTSMATPFAAGVGALMLDASSALTPATVKSVLMSTAVPWGPQPRPNTDFGNGRLDAHAALDAVSASTATAPSVPQQAFVQGSLPATGSRFDHAISITSSAYPIAITFVMPTWSGTWVSGCWLGGDPDFDVYLYDPDGLLVEKSEGCSRQETIGIRPTKTGSWRFHVYSFSGSGPYWYEVSYPGGPPPPPPATPTGLDATTFSDSQINVSWGNVEGENGYRIERRPDGSLVWNQVGSTAADSNFYTDTGLNSSTTYHYRVIAFNSGGSSAPSTPDSATTFSDSSPPTTPTALTAKSAKAKINLAWTASSDPGSGVAFYRIFRSTSSSGPFSTLATSTTTSFSDSSVTKNVTYYYRVSAVNGVGLQSAQSNTANARAR